MSPGSRLTQGLTQEQEPEISMINEQDNPLMENPIEIVEVRLPPKGKVLGVNISRCSYHNLPYILRSTAESTYQKSVKRHLRHNVWILAVGNNDPISAEQALQDLKDAQIEGKSAIIKMVLAKRGIDGNQRTNIAERWASFNQMRMVKMKVLDSDALYNIYTEKDPKEKTSSGYKKIKVNLEGLTNVIYDSPKGQADFEKKKVNIPKKHIEKDVVIPADSFKDSDVRKAISRRPGLRNRPKVDYVSLANPKVNKLIQLPTKPHTPEHVGEALNSPIRSHWIECLFNCYDKMHNTGTLSCPFPRNQLPKDKKVLPTRLSFEVSLTDILNFYEIKVRMCANGSRMIQGVDFTSSYSPTVDADSFRLSMNIAASEKMIIVFIDASNASQTNVISDPRKRVYVTLPTMYLE